jgi:uncharacterized membrane protein
LALKKRGLHDKKNGFVAFLFLLLAFIDSILLTYIHYTINIFLPDINPFCFFDYAFLDCNSVITSKYALFLGIPVSTLGIFAYLFLMIFLLAVFCLKKELLKHYLAVLYPIILLMLLFSLYELFASLFIVKALCIYCVLLYTCIIVMTISCKLAVQLGHREIFKHFYYFILSLFDLKRRSFNVTLVAGAFMISALFAFGTDCHYKHKIGASHAKEIDKQKDRVIEILKEMLH